MLLTSIRKKQKKNKQKNNNNLGFHFLKPLGMDLERR